MRIHVKPLLLLFVSIASLPIAQGQESFRRDTLKASLKIADREQQLRADGYVLDPISIQRVMSPLGEGDAIKYIQTLPGVTMGGEGGSAIYVRGGNMGSNLMTIDGVPLYGISHLLGLTTVFPGNVIGETSFHAGGFDSDEGNFTASHIRLHSKTGDFNQASGQLSLTPFLASASADVPLVHDKLSFLSSIRLSPIGLEYKALRNVVNRYQNVLKDFETTVGDVFGKITWRPNTRNEVSLFMFGSLDRYGFILNDDTADGMGWNNAIANLSWDTYGAMGLDDVHTAVSFNDHRGYQIQETILNGSYNRLEVRSLIDEVTLSTTATKSWKQWSAQSGVKVRGALFNPGSARQFTGIKDQEEESSLADVWTKTLLATIHGQVEYDVPDKMLFRVSLRGNTYFYGLAQDSESGWMFHPEASMMARFHLTRKFGAEVTLDYLTQYYHTLEGIPMGLSVDMIVPSDKTNPPERARQAYVGIFGNSNAHAFRAGGFYKTMNNLVYYGEATSFFNSAQAGWHDNIKVGEGTSYGLEVLYEKTGKVLSGRVSYTWSKTDRFFPGLNRNRRFPAKYDRRHVANASLDWAFLRDAHRELGFNTLFTWQNGSWETLQDGTLPAFLIGRKDSVSLPFISSLNNYNLPPYIRWDVALHGTFKRKQVKHDLVIGIYNLLNRHNPFMLRFNPDTHEWNLISLFPIMPSIKYTLEFDGRP